MSNALPFDLGAGSDEPHLSATSPTPPQWANTETITGGGTGADSAHTERRADNGHGGRPRRRAATSSALANVANTGTVKKHHHTDRWHRRRHHHPGCRRRCQSLLRLTSAAAVRHPHPWGTTNTATVANTQTIAGGTGADAITLGTGFTTAMQIDLGTGANKLTLAGVANTGSVSNVNTLIGGAGADAITLNTGVTGGSIDLGAGNDTLTLAAATNSATVANTETIAGGTGNDTVTLSTAVSNASVDLGAGSDSLIFGNFTNSATVANTETITGGTGADSVTLGGALTTAMAVDLGAGSNKLSLANVANTGTVKNTTTLIGGTGADTITLGAAAVSASIDLGGGSDTLTLGNFTNTATVANTETIAGGTGADTITLGTGFTTAMQIDLGTGVNKLTLAAGGNTGSVSNVNTLIGGSGADTVTYNTALVGGSVDLGTGSNTLQLANFTNVASVANTETAFGGSGNDTFVLTEIHSQHGCWPWRCKLHHRQYRRRPVRVRSELRRQLYHGSELQRCQRRQDCARHNGELDIDHQHGRFERCCAWPRLTARYRRRLSTPHPGTRGPCHERRQWRVRLPTKHRRTVLQRQRQLYWWRHACGRGRQQQQHPVDLQCKQLHASLRPGSLNEELPCPGRETERTVGGPGRHPRCSRRLAERRSRRSLRHIGGPHFPCVTRMTPWRHARSAILHISQDDMQMLCSYWGRSPKVRPTFSNLGISLGALGQDDAAETAYTVEQLPSIRKCAARHTSIWATS